eukprot:CAMPEP_0116035826 /NCGR_PEP_ID=MMETSP0321-20121206/20665_1 /TAXON_ID=163516 /ORGANISM="Leptocylindrus danicus var. danicus, Strain B650" /LENGTH=180 /DNA_ID=CAMNT_0003512865 /DNA_START=88 /DNA_END=633 /DNA_ORIENTATION=-
MENIDLSEASLQNIMTAITDNLGSTGNGDHAVAGSEKESTSSCLMINSTVEQALLRVANSNIPDDNKDKAKEVKKIADVTKAMDLDGDVRKGAKKGRLFGSKYRTHSNFSKKYVSDNFMRRLVTQNKKSNTNKASPPSSYDRWSRGEIVSDEFVAVEKEKIAKPTIQRKGRLFQKKYQRR